MKFRNIAFASSAGGLLYGYFTSYNSTIANIIMCASALSSVVTPMPSLDEVKEIEQNKRLQLTDLCLESCKSFVYLASFIAVSRLSWPIDRYDEFFTTSFVLFASSATSLFRAYIAYDLYDYITKAQNNSNAQEGADVGEGVIIEPGEIYYNNIGLLEGHQRHQGILLRLMNSNVLSRLFGTLSGEGSRGRSD